MIEINDIINDMNKFNETDAFYYDCGSEVAYHVHINNLGDKFYMKKVNGVISKIVAEEFEKGVNLANGNSISDNNYYEL